MWSEVNLHFVRDGLNPIQLETSSSAVLRGLANWKAKGQLQTTPTTGKRRKCLILFQFSTTLHFGGSRPGASVIARINALKLLEQGTRLVPSLGWDALWSIRKLWPWMGWDHAAHPMQAVTVLWAGMFKFLVTLTRLKMQPKLTGNDNLQGCGKMEPSRDIDLGRATRLHSDYAWNDICKGKGTSCQQLKTRRASFRGD